MRPTLLTALSLALLPLLLGACAVAPPATAPDARRASDLAQLARADTLVLQGCYRCLVEASVLYEDVLRRGVEPATSEAGVFRTALLAGLREREMGLPGEGTFARARELANAATAPAEWRTFLEIADVAPWQDVGLTREFLANADARWRQAHDERRDDWNNLLQPLVPTDPVAAYLYLTLNCTGRWFAEQPPELADVLAGHGHALFVRYRQARCSGGLVELSSITTLEPRFTEMEFFLGQLATQDQNPALAEFHFQAARDDWPDWPAPALALGRLVLTAEDFEGSLAPFDEVLTLVPDQRDALLGKAMALSYLEQAEEALPPLDRSRPPSDGVEWRRQAAHLRQSRPRAVHAQFRRRCAAFPFLDVIDVGSRCRLSYHGGASGLDMTPLRGRRDEGPRVGGVPRRASAGAG